MILKLKQFYYLAFIAMVFTLSTGAFAQKTDSGSILNGGGSLLIETRPFDFRNKFYEKNGIMAGSLINRPNGQDGNSILDPSHITDTQHNDMRLLATRPAYGPEGKPVYWNIYGEFNQDAFTNDSRGQLASELAFTFPIYIFPSVNMIGGERQASVITASESYFENNVLGLGIAMIVEYTGKNATTTDLAYLAALEEKNGSSIDGTPIICTEDEIGQLQNRELVTVKVQGDSGPRQTTFIVAKVIQFPGQGAIAPDAFLIYVKDVNGNVLPAEELLVRRFNCLRTGATCGE